MIRKTLFASAMAGAIALTSVTATPAAAAPDGQDYLKLLLGALAVGAIVNARNNERDRERAAAAARSDRNGSGYIRRDDGRDDDGRDFGRDRDHGHGHGRGHGRGHVRGLPAECAFEVRTRRGWTDVFGKYCLEREGVRISRLPESCAFEIRSDRGRRTVYGSRCLSDHGYTVEARRR